MLDSIASCFSTASTTLVEESIARANRPNAAGVYVARCDDAARHEAEIADLMRGRAGAPPFAGVPITIKDNVALAGLATTAGSKVLASAPPATADAPLVTRLRQAGFVILGRTNMTEFAFSGVGLNPHYGTPHNPAFAEAHIPGGSSSGAGVAVALGLAPVAIGTDTGGSVRIPAALCGVVGFKPTASAITLEGIHPLAHSLDSVGVLGRSVADCRAVFDVLRGAQGAPAVGALDGQRLGVIENYMHEGIEPQVARAYDAALAKLGRKARLIPIRLPEIDEIPALFRKGSMVGPEAFAWHRDIIAGRERECDPKIISRLANGAAMAAHDYVVLQLRRAAFQAAVAARVRDLDALVAPTVPITAPRIDAVQEDAPFSATNALLLRNPTVVNFLDGCALSLPCHEPGTVPVGLSVIGLGAQDDKILRLGAAVEAALA
jgi:aspartyl-tRNA(Asn)/glutamyl-tRNA(Gln) amidotransferase subunit A